MLKMDLLHLTKEQLADVVAMYCTEIGVVKSVVILQPTTGVQRAYALVTMVMQEELDSVVNLVGDGQVGMMAVVYLEHEERPVPSFLLSRANAPSVAHA
jgi:hypothetical protein